MRSRKVFAVAALMVGVLVLTCSTALGDRGSIRPAILEKVNIEEPAQRAIIAHNGSREILILQTDVRADEEMKIVEFMPLPSKPKVSLAPKGCFAALQEIVTKHNLSVTLSEAAGVIAALARLEQVSPRLSKWSSRPNSARTQSPSSKSKTQANS